MADSPLKPQITPDKTAEHKDINVSVRAEAGRKMVHELQNQAASPSAAPKETEVKHNISNPTSELQPPKETLALKPEAPSGAPEILPPPNVQPNTPETAGLSGNVRPRSPIEYQPVPRVNSESLSKPVVTSEAAKPPDSMSSKSSQQFFLPESLNGRPSLPNEGSLIIPPIVGEHYDSPKLSSDAPVARVSQLDAAPQPSPAKMTFGELAAKLNQGEAQHPLSAPLKNLESMPARQADAALTDRTALAPINRDVLRQEPNFAELNSRRDLSAANFTAQPASTEATKSSDKNPQTVLQGRISIAGDAFSPPNSSRPEITAVEKDNAAYKASSTPEARRVDVASGERPTDVVTSKIDVVDTRTSKTDGAALSKPSSKALKSDRVEAHSTNTTTRGAIDANKPNDDAKSRAEISNSSRREPLIIPGVITGRTSDTKTPGTASDASASKKDIGKADKTGDKADQHGDTKVASPTSNVISGVAGRIMDGLSNIKGILVPGAKPNAESTTGKTDSRVEHLDHLTQPKPMDATLAIGKDLKTTNPTAGGTEFIINSKKEISDPREETLSSKAGGLKQALQQIFGNHPDINADLKANVFPGPKTVAFENAPSKPGEKPTQVAADNANKSTDAKTVRVDDPSYLRNQKGDKVSTGDLREELADLKSSGGTLKPERTAAEREASQNELKNRQQIKDFTVQLGEIAIVANSVPNSEIFAGHESSLQVDESQSDDEDFDTRYLYYVKEGDTLRSIFDTQIPHEIGNTRSFEYFIKINEQTIRLSSVLAADGMSLVLRVGTVLKLPTPKQLAQLKIV